MNLISVPISLLDVIIKYWSRIELLDQVDQCFRSLRRLPSIKHLITSPIVQRFRLRLLQHPVEYRITITCPMIPWLSIASPFIEYQILIAWPTHWVSSGSDQCFRSQDCCWVSNIDRVSNNLLSIKHWLHVQFVEYRLDRVLVLASFREVGASTVVGC